MWRAPTILVVAVLVLMAIGIVMLASAGSADVSADIGVGGQTSSQHYLQKQFFWLAVAIIAGAATAVLIDYRWWRKLAIPLTVITVLALAAVFVPHIGCRINGARRWAQLGPIRGQPSEIAKFAVIVALASWMTFVGNRAGRLKEGLIFPMAALGAILLLIMVEPDYGTTLLIALTGMTVMLMGGTRILHLFVAGATGGVVFLLAILHNEERMRRFFSFLDPGQYQAEGYQLRQSLNAFILGGGGGVGLGESLQKHGYLPEARTDFIMSIIGEELGIAATLLVVFLFVVIFICGALISMRASDSFGRLLGFGITTMITLQAAINIGVVTGCLPTKGLPLPFISAGGSNLVMALISIGVLVNIALHTEQAAVDGRARVVKDNMHW